MVGILIISHGRLAEVFISSVQFFVGNFQRIKGVSISPKDKKEEVQEQIQKGITEVGDGDGVVILTDVRQDTAEAPSASPQRSDVDIGLQYVRQIDPTFDESVFREASSDIFFKIQAGWANRDLEPVKGLLTSEVYSVFVEDVEKLRREKKINRLENIALRSVDLVEVWQESGSDDITVRFLANILDYTVDETMGQLISGSKTDPVKFEEYWTFARPVGNHPWKLSAIQQPQSCKLYSFVILRA